LGNILLLNIDDLQQKLAVHPWIDKISIRKIFPSSIRIDTKERIPVALLEKDGYYLIDREGVLLQKISPQEYPELPVLIDANKFRRDFERKLVLAWTCLESLDEPVRKQIDILDLTEYENVTMRFRSSDTLLKMGASRFGEKFRSFSENRALFATFGPLEYIDFRCEGRLILRPMPQKGKHTTLDSEKEAF
jgi:hypothetical protein